MSTLDRSALRDPDRAARFEWLQTNGRGGFAMGTASGELTRRYHGLLVAAPHSPVHRYVLLAKLECSVHIGDATYELSTNAYPGTRHPDGWQLLESFDCEPLPTWRWRAGGALIEQTLELLPQRDVVVIRTRLIEGDDDVAIEVRPQCTSRFYHTLTAQTAQGEPKASETEGAIALRWTAESPELHMRHNGHWWHSPCWYYHFVLGIEIERGQRDDAQDLFCPGVIQATLRRAAAHGSQSGGSIAGSGAAGAAGAIDELTIVASVQAIPDDEFDSLTQGQLAREATALVQASATKGSASGNATRRDGRSRGALTGTDSPAVAPLPFDRDALLLPLARSAAQFLVGRPDGRSTVIAGYPWFGDWGRDTFISLPGLCLATGRYALAREILESFAGHIHRGMVPNRFPDQGSAGGGQSGDEAAEYNSVDASLWYVHAVARYAAYSGDTSTTKSFLPAVTEILVHYERGTRYGIRLDDDGLLAAGEPGVQLTWMDAKIGDWVVTPRIGKPVEINALWYNALHAGAELARRGGRDADAKRWLELATRCEESFNRRFWCDERGCLYDVVDADHVAGRDDASLRPNQLFAVSLPHAVLRRNRWTAVVSAVRETLLTPIGLRTLSPDHPAYCRAYTGDMKQRDGAYHQGTVWPWLLGPMVSAAVRAGGGSPESRRDARRMLDGLQAHLNEHGLGGVCEVADADPPHRPDGCPWQAWSAAEPLRALCEDVLEQGPK